MGVWLIDADVLARSRFVISPLTDTVAALGVLHHGDVPVGLAEWAAAHRPAYRDYLARRPLVALFLQSALQPRSIADLLVIPPVGGDRTIHDELRRVRETRVEAALAGLAKDLGGPPPTELAVPELPARVADLLEWVWAHTVRPEWPRRRRVFEADIVARTQQLSQHGWAGALSGMRPNMRWLGDGRLQINAYDYPPRTLADAELMFIPSTARRGWVGWDEPHRYAIVYPCSGLLADEGGAAPYPLRRLIGPARASILTLLAAPKSTTQLVALTGFSLGAVGGHLKVLHNAGLAERRRAGRSVLYYRTVIGDQLVRADRRAATPGPRPAVPETGRPGPPGAV